MTKRVEKRARKPVSENQGMFCTPECVSASVCFVQCLYFLFFCFSFLFYSFKLVFFLHIYSFANVSAPSVSYLLRNAALYDPRKHRIFREFVLNKYIISTNKQTNKQESVTVESRRDDSVHIWCVRRWFLAQNEAHFHLLERWQKTVKWSNTAVSPLTLWYSESWAGYWFEGTVVWKSQPFKTTNISSSCIVQLKVKLLLFDHLFY